MSRITIEKFYHINKIRYVYNNEEEQVNYETHTYNELSICEWVELAEDTLKQ